MDDKLFRFFLNFKNDSTGLVEITEPVGFDSANFVIEQDKKRYGRDIMYGNEEVDLQFYKGLFESQGFSMQFEQLLRYYKDYGFEAEVEFIVEVDGSQLVVGLLDFQKAETDQIEYLKCKVIQNTNMAIVKRREDVNVDVFSNKDLDDNPITPVTTKKILLKAKPTFRVSKWNSTQDVAVGFSATNNRNELLGTPDTDSFGANNCQNVVSSGIENTISFFNNRFQLDILGNPTAENFTYLEAIDDLSNVNIKIRNLQAYTNQIKSDFFSNIVTSGGGSVRFVVKYGYDLATSTEIELYRKDFGFVANTPTEYLPNSFDVNIPFINAGMRVWIYLRPTSTATFNQYQSSSLANYTVRAVMESMEVEIDAVSKSIDSVIEGVRHIDYLKQVFKSATGLNVIAPKYDVGGAFYDNFVFNGKLIRQFIGQAFYGTIKENVEQLVELNSDYQINKNNVYIGQYSDFYTNNEVGAYLTAPDSNFKVNTNDRYALNTFEYKYKSFEQDRDESNTVDAIHTSTQWLMPNKQVEGNLVINVPFVRDPFEIESSRRQGINTKDTTSLSNDDKVYIIDVIELPPNSRNSFTRVLKFQYSNVNNTFKLISDGTFNWTLLGFNVGNTIKINTIDYVVSNIENTILTLDYTGTSNSNGEQIFTIDYPLTNVQYTNRTNQGFALIENIQTGQNFSNLRYSIKRNLKYWFPYLKTASKFKPSGKIKNTYFKSNGLAKTKFTGETTNTIEGADILVSDLGEAILSTYLYNTKLIAGFDEVKETLDKMQQVNENNSIGGFIRIMDNNFRVVKVYPTKLDYSFPTAELDLIGEELQESEFLTIETIGTSLIKINEVGYDSTIIKPIQLRTNGDYIQVLDNRGVGLHNEIKFDKVSVNSNIFSNIVELSEALLTL